MTQKLMTIGEFCEQYSISRSTFYRLVNGGDLTIVKIGSATRITQAVADAWFNSLSA